MALRSGYKGFKKLINGLKVLRPGVLGIDIGTGLAIGQDGKLNVTGVDVTVAGNPEEAATAGDLTKLQIGSDIFNVPDTTYSNATTTTAGLMSATDKEKLDGLDTVQTITHAEAVTGDDVSVTFTEDIVGNIEQIRGSVVSSVDKTAGSQCSIALGSVLAHKPVGKIVGCINSSVSASDRKPINNITLDGNGSIQISGQMVADRGYDFSFIYVFAQ